jgi:hypothetical protein
MRAIIFTDESGVKFPEIKKWTKHFGRGINIEKHTQLISLLKMNNLDVPSNNIDLEDKYRKILEDFIRPSKYMFAGSFNEVRDFTDTLSTLISTNLYIISSRYGLLKEFDTIIPYSSSIQTLADLDFLNINTDFYNKMLVASQTSDIVILLVPREYILYFLKNSCFDELKHIPLIIIVSSKNLKSEVLCYDNVILLERRGVARIGKKNKKIGSVEMLVKSLSFSLIPQKQPIYRSTFENIQGIENCMINEVFYRAKK